MENNKKLNDTHVHAENVEGTSQEAETNNVGSNGLLDDLIDEVSGDNQEEEVVPGVHAENNRGTSEEEEEDSREGIDLSSKDHNDPYDADGSRLSNL